MQKKIIALAIAGLASTAAFAQSNVTIYGRADVGIQSRGGNDGGVQGTRNKTEMGNGLNAGSRLGFKGVEDLGNGLKTIFQAEFGIAFDQAAGTSGTATSNATWTNRNSYVGLAGGFGTVVAGRLDGVRYGVYGKYDAFANGGIGNFTQMTIQYDRADNAIAYISPNFAGFDLILAHSRHTGVGKKSAEGSYSNLGDTNNNNGDDVLYTAKLGYTNGAFTADVDYETTFKKDIDADGNKLYVATVGAAYDFGVVKVGGLYDILKAQGGSSIGEVDQRAYLLSAKAPIGKFTVKATWGKLNNRLAGSEDKDATKLGLGVDYALSKRTQLYANYGRIWNKDGSTVGTSGAYTITSAANSNTGIGVQGVEFGIGHNF